LSQIKLALIGFGRIGKIHAENILHMNGVELTLVIDPLLDEGGQLFDSNTKSSKNIKTLSAFREIDGVIICSPSTDHIDQIKTVSPQIKNIFCEKPLALDIDEIKLIQELTIKQNLNLHIGFNRRFDPDFHKLKKNIDDGVIGDIYQITITSRDPSPPSINYIKKSGGLFLDMTIHDFDMIRYLSKAEVAQIYAMGKCMVDPKIGNAGDIDTAIINMKLSNGILANINNSRKAVYGYDQRIEVLGSNGSLQVGNQLLHGINKGTKNGFSSGNPKHFFIDRYADSYKIEMENFINSINNKEILYPSVNDAMKSLEIGIAANKSLINNKSIQLKNN
jgi:myo-inositol 2-dehydrogenase/D-chiro-inositol 1-dehydrogenase